MSVKQLSVFLENKEGKLKKAVNAMSQAGVNIRQQRLCHRCTVGSGQRTRHAHAVLL